MNNFKLNYLLGCTIFFMLFNPFVFVVPDDVDPLCSKYKYLLRYTIESGMTEKYYISMKNMDVVGNSEKVYFGDGFYKKFKSGTFVSIGCDFKESKDEKIVFNSYNFSKLTGLMTLLNYNFTNVTIIYNPTESYDNLYYYCIGKKFSEYLMKSGYRIEYIPVLDYNSLFVSVNKIRSHRVIHLINNSVDYISYKGKTINNSSISKFIIENADNVILISFSSYHCKSGIAHICLDSSYKEFKSSLDVVLSGSVKNSIIINDTLSINSALFKLIPSPDISGIMTIVSEVY